MQNSKLETVIVGGAGKTGRRVEQRLRERGVPVRLASRSSSCRLDWSEPATWAPALRGAKAVYVAFAPDLAMPGAAEQVGALSRVAAEGGAERIVLLSGRGEHQVWPAERAVRDAGVPFTIVRCAWFSQNFSEGQLLEAVLRGELALPATDATEPFVDLEDVADVVAAALTDPRHEGRIYDLTGPQLLSFPEALAKIGRASGRELQFRSVSPAELGDALAAAIPRVEADFLAALFAQLLDGHNSLLTDGVERALGRPPRDFDAYVRDAVARGAWG
jgi:uncharacterized protein YbjT (DUF2867 family)